MLAFVIISGGSRPGAVERLLRSLAAQRCADAEVLVVGRHDADLPPPARLLSEPALASDAAICAMRNAGIDATRGDPVVLLDDDVEFTPGWYGAMAPSFASERFDITGCRCVTPRGARWYDWAWASRLDADCPPRLLRYDDHDANAYISGCFMAIRRKVFASVRFDERRANHERDDVDFCHRATDAGFSIGVVPEATVIHHLDPAGRSSADPASGSTAFSQGIALWRLERFAEALPHFVAARNPEGVRARYHEGLCLDALDDADGAREAFEDVLRAGLRPGGGEARRLYFGAAWRLGLLLERAGQFAEAHERFAEAHSGFPEHREAAEGLRRTTPAGR